MMDKEDLARFAREMSSTHPEVKVDGQEEVAAIASAEHVCEAQITDPTPRIVQWTCPCGKTKVLSCEACSEPLRIAMDWDDPCEHGVWLANQL